MKNELCLDFGKVYECLGLEDGLLAVVDESGDAYLYDPYIFEIINEKQTTNIKA